MTPTENVQPFHSPGFVGRTDTLRKLEAALKVASRGEATIAVLAGEPGIGKTRLAQEIESRHRAAGGLSFWGRFYENQPVAPYWPWRQIGKACVSFVRDKRLPAEHKRAASELKRFLSVPGPTREGIRGGSGDIAARGDYERIRFFDAVATLLACISEHAPLLLVLDNLHCADEGSLQLLEFLSIELERDRVLLVATYRNVDLDPQHPLHVTLGELARRPHFLHMALSGLDPSELSELARQSMGEPPSDELVETLSRRTEGNPLYTIELVKLMCEQRSSPSEGGGAYGLDGVPESVALAIRSRLARHSRGCVELLVTASMLGREFDLDALSRVTGEPISEELAASLQEGVRAGFIEQLPRAGSAYRFTHALIQDVLSTQLASPLSAAAHEHIGTKLEEHYGGTAIHHAATLAYHFSRSSSASGRLKLARYAHLAGEEALDANDYRRAVRYFLQALEARSGVVEDETTADILFGLGRARALDGHEQEGGRDISAAFNIYTRLGKVGKAVEVATFPLVFAYGYEVSFNLLAEIMDRVRKDSLEWAWLETYRIVHEFRERPQSTQTDTRFREILALARKHGNERLELHVLLAWYYIGYACMRMDEVLKNLPRIAELARNAGDLRAQTVVQIFLYAQAFGRQKRRHHTHAALRKAERVRDRALLCLTLSLVSAEDVHDGAWDNARSRLDRAISIYPRFTFGSVYARRARVEYETGHLERGDTYLYRYLDAYRAGEGRNIFEYTFLVQLIVSRMRITGRKEHTEVAATITSEVLASPQASPRNILQSLLSSGLLAVELGDRDEAAAALARLEEMRRSHGITGNESVLGLVASGAGERDRAEDYLREGIATARREGHRPDLAWSSYDYAHFLIRQREEGSGGRIRQLLAEAGAIARELGMRPLETRVTALAAGEGKGGVDPKGERLTGREREVLGQITLGKTNQEISRDLSISEHTVAHHVSAILKKIGVTNRVDAAVYATRHGMEPV